MQTFLPFPSFSDSARALDRTRLGKQRLETMQILKAIDNPAYGWQHHPTVQMWRKNKNALVLYGVAICNEWRRRGYRDTCKEKIIAHFDKRSDVAMPCWMGDEEFHAAHRSNLKRKAPELYPFREQPDMPYVWPQP